MNTATVRAKIIVGFSAVVVLMAILSLFTYLQLRRIEEQARLMRVDSVAGLHTINRLEDIFMSSNADVDRYVRDQDPRQMRQLLSAIQRQTKEIHEAVRGYESTVNTTRDRELYQSVKTALESYLMTRDEVLRSGQEPKRKAETLELLHGQLDPEYKKLRETVIQVVDFNKSSADQESQNIEDTVNKSATALLISLIIGVLIAGGTGYVLVRAVDRPLSQLVAAIEPMREGDFSRKLALTSADEFGVLAGGLNLMSISLSALIHRVQKSGLQVNTSATEIAATSQEQLSTASEVAATTAEIGATSREISVTSKELAQTIKEIAGVAEKTALLASSGQTGLNRMKSTMHQVMEASASINTRLGVLSEKAGSIGAVVTTITKVADQTNLLSLNAAIEAEKAGDAGRGFAVVASEIRRLADQTALATGDIEQIVKEMQTAVAAGVMGMDKFSEEVRRGGEVVQQVSEELTQIITHVQALTPDFETVSDGMQSQSQGAQQISDALAQLSEASKQTVDSLRQSNAAIDQLNDAARGLQDGVSRFTLQT